MTTLAYKLARGGEVKLDEAGAIEVAFAQLGVIDADGDVTLPGAFPSKDVPISAYGHTSWEGALPVGRGTISEEGDWAVLRGRLFMDTSQGRDAHATLKGLGELAEYSYGYRVLDGGPGTHEGRPVRELRRLDVHEVSPVLRGAGVGTHTRSIKDGAPGPGTPWTEHLSWYAEGLPALLERVRARADLRSAEGRKLSRTDRARLEDIEAALAGHLEAVRELLVVPEDPKAAEARRIEVAILAAQAAGLGVPV